MSWTINNLLFGGFCSEFVKKSCPGLSWLTPGDLRHCHNTQNIGCDCQKRNSGPNHIRILEKFGSDFKLLLATPKKSSDPWFPSDAELKEEFGSNFFWRGGRNLSVVSALFLVSPHLNGDVAAQLPQKSRETLNREPEPNPAGSRGWGGNSCIPQPIQLAALCTETAWPCFWSPHQKQHLIEENELGWTPQLGFLPPNMPGWENRARWNSRALLLWDNFNSESQNF